MKNVYIPIVTFILGLSLSLGIYSYAQIMEEPLEETNIQENFQEFKIDLKEYRFDTLKEHEEAEREKFANDAIVKRLDRIIQILCSNQKCPL